MRVLILIPRLRLWHRSVFFFQFIGCKPSSKFHAHYFLRQSNKCWWVFPCSSSDWESIRASVRNICKASRFLIMAPQQRWQHVHLSAPTFCTHYIWIKVIEWIDLSALASGRPSKRRSPRRLPVCVLRAEKQAADRICYCHRWSPEPSLLDKWRKHSTRCPPRLHTDWRRECVYGWLALWHWGQQVFADWTRSTPRLNATLRFLYWWGRWAERFKGDMESWVIIEFLTVWDLCRSAFWGIAAAVR